VPAGHLRDVLNRHYGPHTPNSRELAALLARKGTAQYNTGGAISTYTTVTGIHDFKLVNGTRAPLAGSQNGSNAILSKWNSGAATWDSVKTGLTPGRFSAARMSDKMILCGKNTTDRPQVWDGTAVTELGVLTVDHQFSEGTVVKGEGDLTDYSSETGDNGTGQESFAQLGGMTSSQYVYVGFEGRTDESGQVVPPLDYQGLLCRLDSSYLNAVASITLTAEYSVEVTGGYGWSAMPNFTDGTATGGTTFAATGFQRVYWDIVPGNWFKCEYQGKKKFWLRLKVSNTISADVRVTDVFAMGYCQEVFIRAGGEDRTETGKINDWDAGTAMQWKSLGFYWTSGGGSHVSVRAPASHLPPFHNIYVKQNVANTASVTIGELRYKTEAGDVSLTSFVDNTMSSGKTMGKDGILSWAPQDDQVVFNPSQSAGEGSTNLDMWQIEMRLANGTISSTAKAQEIVPVYPVTVIYDESIYTDYTSEAADATASDVIIDALSETNGYFYIGVSDTRRIAGIRATVGDANSVATLLIPEYWNGLYWTPVTGLSDGTLDAATSTKTLNQSGDITFNRPTADQWRLTSVTVGSSAYTRYWVRFRPASAAFSATTRLTKIEALQSIIPAGAQFISGFQNRLLLLSEDKAYWSALNDINDFNTESDYKAAFAPVTGAGAWGPYHLMFTDRSTYLLQGTTDPLDPFTKHLIHSTLGCASHFSIVEASRFTAFASHDGFYAYMKGPGQTGVDSAVPVKIGLPLMGLWNGLEEYSALNSTRVSEIVGADDPENEFIWWLVSENGETQHTTCLVFDYGNSTMVPGDESGERGNYVWYVFKFAEDMESVALVETATNVYTLLLGDTNGMTYSTGTGTSDRDSANTATRIELLAEFGEFRGRTDLLGFLRRYTKCKVLGRASSSFDTEVGLAYDHARTNDSTYDLDLFTTGSVETFKIVYLQDGWHKSARARFYHDGAVGEVYDILGLEWEFVDRAIR